MVQTCTPTHRMAVFLQFCPEAVPRAINDSY